MKRILEFKGTYGGLGRGTPMPKAVLVERIESITDKGDHRRITLFCSAFEYYEASDSYDDLKTKWRTLLEAEYEDKARRID